MCKIPQSKTGSYISVRRGRMSRACLGNSKNKSLISMDPLERKWRINNLWLDYESSQKPGREVWNRYRRPWANILSQWKFIEHLLCVQRFLRKLRWIESGPTLRSLQVIGDDGCESEVLDELSRSAQNRWNIKEPPEQRLRPNRTKGKSTFNSSF